MFVVSGKQNMLKTPTQCENIFTFNIEDSRMTSLGINLVSLLLTFEQLCAGIYCRSGLER